MPHKNALYSLGWVITVPVGETKRERNSAEQQLFFKVIVEGLALISGQAQYLVLKFKYLVRVPCQALIYAMATAQSHWMLHQLSPLKVILGWGLTAEISSVHHPRGELS